MKVLGIRCSNSDYTFSVLDGTKTSPSLIDTRNLAYPQGFRLPKSLKWFLLEIDALLTNHSIERIVIKGFEGRTRGKAYEERVEHEAMVFLAAENHGLKAVFRKVKGTIAKDLGLKGRGQYLSTSLDTSAIANFDSYDDKTKESIWAAWSELP